MLLLPRSTTEQANYGKHVRKEDIQTGDLIFFKTGRGPNGYHVGDLCKRRQIPSCFHQRGLCLFFNEYPLLVEILLASQTNLESIMLEFSSIFLL